MNITFLIGNGFDVGLGMKSKFSDYFPLYIKASENKSEEIKMLSQEIKYDEDTWAYFEKQKGEYTSKFDLKTQQKYINQFKDFESSFIDYLIEEEKQLSYSNNEKICTTFIKGLTDFYKGQNFQAGSRKVLTDIFQARKKSNHIYNFITFNYTSTLENCIKTLPNGVLSKRKIEGVEWTDKIGSVVHVHGTFEDGPIMGVDNVGQVANKELANSERFLKYLVKPLINELHRNTFDAESEALIDSSDVICVYGMSLGETDAKWWVKIIRWLNANSNRHFVIFNYDEKYNQKTPYSYIEKEEKIIDALQSYLKNLAINVNGLKSRIHIAIHKNIFAMNLKEKKKPTKLKKSNIIKANSPINKDFSLQEFQDKLNAIK